MISGGIEVEHWLKIGYVLNVLHINSEQIQDNIQLINTVLLLRNLNIWIVGKPEFTTFAQGYRLRKLNAL